MVSGSWDKTIRLWDVQTSKSDLIFKGHTKDVLSVAFSHDERLIFSGSMDNTLKYWNTKGDLRFDNTQFRGWVSSILNIKKGKLIILLLEAGMDLLNFSILNIT